jgi:hypothetical protein
MKYLFFFLFLAAIVGVGFLSVFKIVPQTTNADTPSIMTSPIYIQEPDERGLWTPSEVYKFQDPSNGVTCYVTEDTRGGISCLTLPK